MHSLIHHLKKKTKNPTKIKTITKNYIKLFSNSIKTFQILKIQFPLLQKKKNDGTLRKYTISNTANRAHITRIIKRFNY